MKNPESYPPANNLRLSIKQALQQVLDNPSEVSFQADLRQLVGQRCGQIIAIDFPDKVVEKNIPSISLCMIVKNEENNLKDCLASVANLVNQIIIVDTGSTDKTVEIARQAGAQVEFFPWRDDFSASRNVSLKYATGEWVLVLDADERILEEDIRKIKLAVSSGDADIYLFRQHHILADKDAEIEINLIDRLFRNRPEIRFQNVIHETILPSVVKQGMVIAETDISIQHLGRLPGLDEIKKKSQRNLEIVEKALQKDPHNQFNQLLTGLLRVGQGNIQQGFELLEKAVQHIPDFPPSGIYLAQAYLLLLNSFMEQRQTERIRALVGEVIIDFPDTYSLWVYAGSIYLNILGEYETARKILERSELLSVNGTTSVYLQKWFPFSDWYAAEQLFWARLLCLGAEGVKLTGSIIQNQTGAGIDHFRIAAREQAQNNEWQKATASLSSAIRKGGIQKGDWEDLALYHLNMGKIFFASRFNYFALLENDSNSRSLTLAGLIAIKRNEIEDGTTYFIRAVLADQQNEFAWLNLNLTASSRGKDSSTLIRQQGFDWMNNREHKLAQTAFEFVLPSFPVDNELRQALAEVKNYGVSNYLRNF